MTTTGSSPQLTSYLPLVIREQQVPELNGFDSAVGSLLPRTRAHNSGAVIDSKIQLFLSPLEGRFQRRDVGEISRRGPRT